MLVRPELNSRPSAWQPDVQSTELSVRGLFAIAIVRGLFAIVLFAIVPDYGNEYMRKESKNWSSLKDFAPKLNLNHNMFLTLRLSISVMSRPELLEAWLVQTSVNYPRNT